MLINKNSSVKTFKLANGDEVIAEVVRSENGNTVVTKPVAIIVKPDQNGNPRLALVPFLFSADDTKEMEINETQIVLKATPTKETVDAYLRSTTDIQLVT